MCGISGIVNFNNAPVSSTPLQAMLQVLRHRGGDDEQIWQEDNIGFAHNRLSIIDLSQNGKQPMHYLHYTIVFNGEIYNYLELKKSLEQFGYSFNTNSDTEVLLVLYHHYKEECLHFLDGMFAFCIYDAHKKNIFCARDRFGEKPFFYKYNKEHFIFASEMKALWEAGVSKKLCTQMAYNYITHGSLSNPNKPEDTFYENIQKLEQGHYLFIDTRTGSFKKIRYYNSNIDNLQLTRQEAIEQLKELFEEALVIRLRSDVAIGTSLSGGIDSSLIAYALQPLLKSKQLNTFSAIFPNSPKNEEAYIKYIASQIPINPNYIIPSSQDFSNQFKQMLWHQEEPVANASVFAQFKVMQLAKEKNVKVLLDGQGADEVFGGYYHYYNNYLLGLKRNDKGVMATEIRYINALIKENYLPKHFIYGSQIHLKNNFPKLANTIRKYAKAYQLANSGFISKKFIKDNLQKTIDATNYNLDLNKTLYKDTHINGLQNLLRFADRNSMAQTIEVRLPFLSHKIVEFAQGLPETYKIWNGQTKWLLRNLNILPSKIVDRKDKIAYEAPQNNWLLSSCDLINEANEHLAALGITDKTVYTKEKIQNSSPFQQEIIWRILNIGLCNAL